MCRCESGLFSCIVSFSHQIMSQWALHVWWWNDSGYQHLFVRHYYNKLKTCIDVILVVLSKLIVVLVFCIACIYCIICARHVSADIPVVLFYCHYKTRMNVTKLLTSALLCFFFFFFKTLKSNNWNFFPKLLQALSQCTRDGRGKMSLRKTKLDEGCVLWEKFHDFAD